MIAQHRQQGFAPLGADAARQRHVKAEVVHHIGIPPAIEMFALLRRQLGRISPCAVRLGERRTERIERADAIGREPDQLCRRFGRDHGDEAADRTDNRPDHRNRPRRCGERLTGGNQLGLGPAGSERQRRLQRGMKAVFAGIAGQSAPVRRGLQDVFRKGQVLAGEGVIAEQRCAEAIEAASGRRGIVDRVARMVGHFSRIEPAHAAATALRGAAVNRIRRSASVR